MLWTEGNVPCTFDPLYILSVREKTSLVQKELQ